MFERMIRAADTSIHFDTVSNINGERLPDPGTLQAILITGSPAGVYDEFDWVARLEDFVRAAYASQIPMVEVCFGHQLMAQVLGGRVRRSPKRVGASDGMSTTSRPATASSTASGSQLPPGTRAR